MNLPKRKSPRLKDYDYSTPGYYFVTVCTHNKEKILCDFVSEYEGFVGEGLCALPSPKLSNIGKAVQDAIEHIDSLNNISVNKYVIMPNHIHLIIIVHPDTPSTQTGGRGDPPLQDKIGADDAIARLKSFTTHLYGKRLWQRSFHDHIIRSDEDYKKIWEYIDTNPHKWKDDCFYVE